MFTSEQIEQSIRKVRTIQLHETIRVTEGYVNLIYSYHSNCGTMKTAFPINEKVCLVDLTDARS